MQQLHSEAEKETRYDLETVKRAAALAVKLQEGQRNTLTQAEVDGMAAEAGIDPVCMRQALNAVRQEQTRALHAQRALTPQKRRASVALAAAAALGVALVIPGLYLVRAAPPAPATVAELMPTPVAEVIPAPAGFLLKNGALTAPATLKDGTVLSAGSTAVPGWKVLSGQARYLRLPGSGQSALALGPNTWFEQLVPTVTGASYRLRYEIAGEAGSEARLHRITVKAIQPDQSETSQEASVFTEGGATGPAGWTVHQMEFQARDVATRIDFGSAQPTDGSSLPVIRNIRIEQTSSVATP